MNTIEQIKILVNQRIKELDEQIVDIYDSKAVLRKDELQKLLSRLSDLEKDEKPMQDGLEEEIREFVEQEWDGLHDNDGNPLYTADYLEYIARHFAQWGAEHLDK